MHLPHLDPYPGYTQMPPESHEDAAYEDLPGGDQICPERHVNIVSSTSLELIWPFSSYSWLCSTTRLCMLIEKLSIPQTKFSMHVICHKLSLMFLFFIYLFYKRRNQLIMHLLRVFIVLFWLWNSLVDWFIDLWRLHWFKLVLIVWS